MTNVIIVRGGGDLGSGVAVRLHRAGMRVIITELPQPLVVRRLVSFAEAVYRGRNLVEDVEGVKVEHLTDLREALKSGFVPVIIDPDCRLLFELNHVYPDLFPAVLVDARMMKREPDLDFPAAPLVIGLGPGFTAGENCHAVIETKRGFHLGRVIWKGSASPDTGIPEGFGGAYHERVLRAPTEGVFRSYREICDLVETGELIAEVDSSPIYAPFKGVLRGLLHPGLRVEQGTKVGDLDPRCNPAYCTLISDKSLAVGGAVLEAILTRADLRWKLWEGIT